MKVYYQDGLVTIYHGDARVFVPNLRRVEVDAVVADPPYGVDGGSTHDSRVHHRSRYGKTSWPDNAEYIRAVIVPIVRLLVDEGYPMAITPGIPMMFAYPQPRDVGCFWTPAATSHGPWGFTNFQPILYYGRDWRAGKGIKPTGRQLTELAEQNGHPCPKPIEAWTWLVDKVTPPLGTVLDPFMGSGTDPRRRQVPVPPRHRHRNRRTLLRNRGAALFPGSPRLGGTRMTRRCRFITVPDPSKRGAARLVICNRLPSEHPVVSSGHYVNHERAI